MQPLQLAFPHFSVIIVCDSLLMKNLGDWRSWLARAVWDREVEGSSPLSPTKKNYCINTLCAMHGVFFIYNRYGAVLNGGLAFARNPVMMYS